MQLWKGNVGVMVDVDTSSECLVVLIHRMFDFLPSRSIRTSTILPGYCVVSGTSNSLIWATNSESGYWFPQGPSSLKFSTNLAISVPTAPSSLEFSPNLAIHVPTPSKSSYC